MNRLHTVFWDLDGTLADTEMMGHRKAFNQSFSEFHLDWTWDQNTYSRLLSIPGGKNRIKYFAKEKNVILDNRTINLLHQQKQKYYQEILHSGCISLRTGVMRLVLELYARNTNQWIVTTSSKLAVQALLKKSFPRRACPFGGYTTFEDVIELKPHPEAYFKAIKSSSAELNNSLAIEDSLIGYQAASASKLKTLITLSPWLTKLPEGINETQLVVDSLGDQDNASVALQGKRLDSIITYKSLQLLIN